MGSAVAVLFVTFPSKSVAFLPAASPAAVSFKDTDASLSAYFELTHASFH